MTTRKIDPSVYDSEARAFCKKIDFPEIKTKVFQCLAAIPTQTSEATEILAEYIKNHYFIKSITNDQKPEIYFFSKGIYEPNGISKIKAITRTILEDRYTSQFVNRVIDKISVDTYIKEEEFFNQQNKFKYHIPVENGLLNIKLKELEDFTPQIYFFSKLPVTFKKNAKCPKIEEFFKQVLTKQKDIDGLQEFFGYSLLKEYRYEKAFLLYSPDGRSGKTKTLDLLQRLLGKSNVSSIRLSDLENTSKSFVLSGLRNKLVNIGTELTKNALQGTGALKSLTGRDPQTADRKFLSPVQFVNYAKMIFSGNELPIPKDLTLAFFSRFIKIDFPFRFLPQAEINKLPLEKRTNVKLENTKIIEEITTTEELSGLLNWALKGFERLETQKSFSNQLTAEETKKEWLTISNSFSVFAQDILTEDYEGKIEVGVLKRVYLDYCRTNKTRPEKDRYINEYLQKELGCIQEKPHNVRTWIGIKFKNCMVDVN